MTVYVAIIIGIIVIVMITFLIVFIATRPLPEWNGLHGEEYKKWRDKKLNKK